VRLKIYQRRSIGDVEYSKLEIVVRPWTVEKLGWKEGQELSEIPEKRFTLNAKDTKDLCT